MLAVHQLVPDLSPGDAVSGHALELQRLLVSLGVRSEIYCEQVHPSLAARAHHHREYRDGALIHHLAIGSVLGDLAIEGSMPVAVDHHNLTPPEFFQSWEPALVHGILWGRRQLAQLAGRADLGLADSTFNAGDLVNAGFRSVQVAPILLDTAQLEREVDAAALDSLAGSSQGGDWLFVGRIVPNKAQHDVIRAFAAHIRIAGAPGRLFLVGRTSVPRYEAALRALIDDLGLADRVVLTGGVDGGTLAAHYANADVFVCLSEHEGFCVPLLEAMHHGTPVVAFAAGAIPETLGDAGLCLPSKDPVLVAEAVARVQADAALAERLVAAGHRRVEALSLTHTRQLMQQALTPWLERLR